MPRLRMLALACLPLALAGATARAASADETHPILERLAQGRCELIDLQYQLRGQAEGTPAYQAAAERLYQRAAQVQSESAGDIERLGALFESLGDPQRAQLARDSDAMIDSCSKAAMASYRARVEAGIALGPHARPQRALPYAEAARDKAAARQKPAKVEKQEPAPQ